MIPDYGHSLLNKYSKVVGKCICKYVHVLNKAPLKVFKRDLLESVSASVVLYEGADRWVPCLDPNVKGLHKPLDEAINRIFHERVRGDK